MIEQDIYPAVRIVTEGKTYCHNDCPRLWAFGHCCTNLRGADEPLRGTADKPLRRPWCRAAATEVKP